MDKRLEYIIGRLTKDLEEYNNYLSETFIVLMDNVVKILDESEQNSYREIYDIISSIIPKTYVLHHIYIRLIFLPKIKDEAIALEMYDILINDTGLTLYNKYYLMFQMFNVIFTNTELDTVPVACKRDLLLRQIGDGFAEKMGLSYSHVPYEKRNKNKVVVITSQLLSVNHGPTKTCLDRCKVLIDKLGKEVVLINSAEIYSSEGILPVPNRMQSGYVEDYQKINAINWNGTAIPFYQMPQETPDIGEYRNALSYILKVNPEIIISIGGHSIFSALCNRFYPVLTVGLCPSMLDASECTYGTIGHRITRSERDRLEPMGRTEDYIIESVFTSGLAEQKETVTRDRINATEDDFVIATVGGRLDKEITPEFLDMISRTPRNVKFAFLGVFKKWDEIKTDYPELKDRVIYNDYANDVLAYYDCCDLYINPTRRGGGTSAVEALSKGIPVVTTEFGDVYTNAGEEFVVEDYEEMLQTILRYVEDKAFYEEMSKKARARVNILLDTEGQFVNLYNEAIRREKEKWQ